MEFYSCIAYSLIKAHSHSSLDVGMKHQLSC